MTIDFFLYKICFILFLSFLAIFPASQSFAATKRERKVEVEVLAILKTDELGAALIYPSSVTYDKEMDEIYVIAGGEGKVVVYNASYFPTVSLSRGRGADSPRGVYIDTDSTLYICQAGTLKSAPKITTFNPAFFPQKDILFSSIPDTENFSPKNMIMNQDGYLYVIGLNSRGVLVLDGEGNFSHWLKPLDKIYNEEESEDNRRDDGMELTPELTAVASETADADQSNILENSDFNMRDLLPSDLLPTISNDETTVVDQSLKPVLVADIITDSSGHLYVLSEETSKIYVYNQNEEFLFSFGQKGGSTGKMSRPKSLAIDEKKKALYVVDYMRHTILIYDLGGKFVYEFGGMGAGPGWFQYPIDLALTKEGYLIVADLFNQRVQILNIDFEYTFPLSLGPGNTNPKPSVQTQPSSSTPGPEVEPAPEQKPDESLYFPKPIYL
jgi:DNA-binding beta-propeller fold protein YncE